MFLMISQVTGYFPMGRERGPSAAVCGYCVRWVSMSTWQNSFLLPSEALPGGSKVHDLGAGQTPSKGDTQHGLLLHLWTGPAS